MATAYNRFLACYYVFGFEDDETNAALEAAFALDPGRWVPLLLAGGVLGAPGRSARVALGSKEEATLCLTMCLMCLPRPHTHKYVQHPGFRDHHVHFWLGFVKASGCSCCAV